MSELKGAIKSYRSSRLMYYYDYGCMVSMSNIHILLFEKNGNFKSSISHFLTIYVPVMFSYKSNKIDFLQRHF